MDEECVGHCDEISPPGQYEFFGKNANVCIDPKISRIADTVFLIITAF